MIIIYVKLYVIYIYKLLLKCCCYYGNYVVNNVLMEIIGNNMYKVPIISVVII